MPPKLCRFLAMLGVLCRTLEAARAPASDVLGVRVAIEDAEGRSAYGARLADLGSLMT